MMTDTDNSSNVVSPVILIPLQMDSKCCVVNCEEEPLHPIPDKNILIQRARGINLEIDTDRENLCQTHYNYFEKFYELKAATHCCDPFNNHKKKMTKSLRRITYAQACQWNLICGQRVCVNCQIILRGQNSPNKKVPKPDKLSTELKRLGVNIDEGLSDITEESNKNTRKKSLGSDDVKKSTKSKAINKPTENKHISKKTKSKVVKKITVSKAIAKPSKNKYISKTTKSQVVNNKTDVTTPSPVKHQINEKHFRALTKRIEFARFETQEAIKVCQQIFLHGDAEKSKSEWFDNIVGPLVNVIEFLATSTKTFQDYLQLEEKYLIDTKELANHTVEITRDAQNQVNINPVQNIVIRNCEIKVKNCMLEGTLNNSKTESDIKLETTTNDLNSDPLVSDATVTTSYHNTFENDTFDAFETHDDYISNFDNEENDETKESLEKVDESLITKLEVKDEGCNELSDSTNMAKRSRSKINYNELDKMVESPKKKFKKAKRNIDSEEDWDINQVETDEEIEKDEISPINHPCKFCGKSFGTKTFRNVHYKNQHSVSDSDILAWAEEDTYDCERCHFKTTNKIFYNSHVWGSACFRKCPWCPHPIKTGENNRPGWFDGPKELPLKYFKEHFDANHPDLCLPSTGGFICKSCNAQFLSMEDYLQHVEVEHKITYVYHCKRKNKCDQQFTSLELFKKHLRKEHSKFSCDQCPFVCDTKSQLEHHINGKHFSLLCELCNDGREYESRSHLTKHKSKMHGIRKQIKAEEMCQICGKTFTKKAIKKHLKTAHSKNFQCDKCKFLTACENSLKKHQEARHSTALLCDFCPYSTGCKSTLEQHRKKHTVKIACTECDFITYSNLKLDNHILEMHREEKKVYQCDICQKICNSSDALWKHKETHDDSKKKKCPECDYTDFRQKLRNHITKHHKRDKNQCTKCDFIGLDITRLKWHISYVHEGIKFDCDICSKSFQSPSVLKTHKLKVHEGVRYSCDKCDYSAFNNSELRDHELSAHQGFSYQCPHCSRLFGMFGQLYKHGLKAHKMRHRRKEAQQYFAKR